MKKKMRRLSAILLTFALVLQQGNVLGTFADETEPVTETATTVAAGTDATEPTEQPTEVALATETVEQETQVGEPAAVNAENTEPTEETKPTESESPAAEPETVVSEPTTETNTDTEVPEPATEKSSESESAAEPETETEKVTEAATETETETATESETELATESETELATETESETQLVTESETETVTEKETETESETETETEAKAELAAEVTQEVFQKTTEDAVVPMVKYTVKLTNKTAQTDAKQVALKVVLDGTLSYMKEEGETAELVSFDTLGAALAGNAFEANELNDEQKAAYADGSVVLWKDQTIAGGAEKTFVFFAEVKDGETDVNALRSLWLVDGEAVRDEQIKWVNVEQLEVKKELPSEFIFDNGEMTVTATLSDPAILPEGAEFVVERIELSAEELSLVSGNVQNDKAMAGYVAYDIHFKVGEEEIEPENGSVTISIQYKNGLQIEGTDGGALSENAEYKLLHLPDAQTVETVTEDIDASPDGQVNAMEFTTDSFSPFVLMAAQPKLSGKLKATVKLSGANAPQNAKFYFKFYQEQNGSPLTKSVQLLESKNGVLSFEIKPGDLIIQDNKCTLVLEQMTWATVDGVTFDNTKYKMNVAFTQDPSDGKCYVTGIEYYKGNTKIAEEDLVFQNSYKRVYFNRYSMAGLLNGYNVISFSDATLGNHTVGGVLVGGNLNSHNTSGFAEALSLSTNMVPSYVAGKVTTHSVYGKGAADGNTKAPLYVGASSNKVNIELENDSQNSYVYKWTNEDGTGSACKNGAPVYSVDYPYVNFSTVRAIVTGTMNSYASTAQAATTEDVNAQPAYVVEAGTNAKIESTENLRVNIKDYKFNGMNSNTYITVTGGGKIVIVNELINGEQKSTGDIPTEKDSSSLVWYFPNATEVVLQDGWYGHVIAPNATITMNAGNYGGTLIGNIVITNNSEGHCFPYDEKHGFDLGLYIPVTKELKGRDLKEGEFEFTLTPVSGNPAGDPIKGSVNAKNGADGNVLFGPYKYTTTGTYKYTIREKSGTVANTVYDVSEYTVTVDVRQEGGLSGLTADVTFTKKDGGKDVSADEVVFINKDSNFRDGSIELKAQKVYDGTFPEEGFNFVLEAVGNVPMPTGSEEGRKTITVYDANAQSFGSIVYEKNGTYEYKIFEEIPEDAVDNVKDGILYDTTVYTVTVKVESNADGSKEITATGKPALTTGNTARFTNKTITKEFSVSILKVDESDAPLAGAKLELKDATGKVVDSWTTDGKAHDITGITPGNYTLSEVEAPEGYQVSEDIPVVVAETHTSDAPLVVKMVDKKETVELNSVSILKVDESGAPLAGAKLVLKDAAGNAVDSWTTDGNAHDITGIALGNYTLSEVEAPQGYQVSADIPVTVTEAHTTAAPLTVTMVDKKLVSASISILKVDESNAPLAGAKLVLKDAAGNVVDAWTTDGKAHDITGVAFGNYTLSEIEAPQGYQVSADIPVSVTDANSAAPLAVTMTDKKIPASDNRSLTVTKHLRLDGITSDLGVREATYYVALFSDEAKTQRVSNVKKIEFKNQTSSSVTFDNLANNTTYYVGETDENGNLLVSKKVNDRVIFYPEYDGSAVVAFEGRKLSATSEFTNVYVELEPGFYLAGQLTITKKVLIGGEEGFTDDTFYARVFSNAALTKPASDVLTLAMNGNSTTSVTVTDLPIGETLDSSAKYFVAETDENGTPLNPDEITEYEISIDNSRVVLSANNSEQEVVITNDFVEEEESEVETEIDEKKTAPKTGDDTDFMRYLLLMAFSFGLFAVAVGQKRSKKREEK